MKVIKINHPLEYLCPNLVLSYFYIHNIILVLIGILLSLYMINIDIINRYIISFNQKAEAYKFTGEVKRKQANINQINSVKEDPKLALFNLIEELVFIPSINENDDSKVR